MDQNKSIKDQKEFDAYKLKALEFVSMYLKERERLYQEDLRSFLKLTPANESIINDVKKLKQLVDKIIVVSGNKKDFIKKILSCYGLEIPEQDIFDGSSMAKKGDKRSIFEKIISSTSEPKNIVYVEDLLVFAKQLIDLEIGIFHADWGFDTKENIKKGRKLGIKCISKNNFYKKISHALK
jgi:hypothetical protein